MKNKPFSNMYSRPRINWMISFIFIMLAIVVMIATECKGQSFIVTPTGLRDSANIEKTFVVIDFPGLTASQLYDNAIRAINKLYKNPNEVITGSIHSEYLKFRTYASAFCMYNNSGVKIPIDARYITELNFKDGRVKYEVVDLDMSSQRSTYKILFTGGVMEGYIIYNKKGDLKKPETKRDIEQYFNSEMRLIITSLKGSKEDW